MLATDDGNGWAQIGFDNANQTNGSIWDLNDFFIQWRRGSGYSLMYLYWGAPSSGSSYDFKATRETSDGYIHLIKDGADEWQTDFDPLNAWRYRNSEFFNETHHRGDDFYGTSGNRIDFSNVQSKTISGWQYQNWNMAGTSECYGHVSEVTGNSHFQSWTAPLDHNC